jgi:glutaredoxin
MAAAPMQRLCALVMEGCPHCRDVPALLKTLADVAPGHLVDSDDPLAEKLGVTSFPTIFLVNPLFTFVYRGPRTPEALRAWVLRKMAATSRFIKAEGGA